MRRLVPLLATLLVLALFAALLRHDLALWGWRQGQERLGAGDPAAALSLFSSAVRRAPHSLPIAFATGVACYRLGQLEQAAGHFRAASRSDSPVLKGAALYNLGNCAFRMGEKAAASDRQAALRLFQETERYYLHALALAPDAADTRHNLALVRARLSKAAGASGCELPRGASGAGDRRIGGTAKSGSEAAQGERQGKESAGRAQERASRSPGEQGDAAAAGRSRAQLSRPQAEQLLNEARGREPGVAALAPQGGQGRLSRPDKDW